MSILPELYRLRWRFDFVTGVVKYGQWDRDTPNEEEKACRVMKQGLIRASIEGKNRGNYQMVTMVECDGHDFVNFAWKAEFRGTFGALSKGMTRVTGLEMWTREERISVFFDGRVHREPRTEADRRYHYSIFGR